MNVMLDLFIVVWLQQFRFLLLILILKFYLAYKNELEGITFTSAASYLMFINMRGAFSPQ